MMFSIGECYNDLKINLESSLKSTNITKELIKNINSIELIDSGKFKTISQFLSEINKKLTGKDLENGNIYDETVENLDIYFSKFNEDHKLIKLLKSCSSNTFNSFLIPLKHILQTKNNILFKEERVSYMISIKISDKIIVSHKRTENIIEEIPTEKVEGHLPMFQTKSSNFF